MAAALGAIAPGPDVHPPGRGRRGALAIAPVAVLAIVAYGVWRSRQFVPLQLSEQQLLSTMEGSQRSPAYSPDGRRLAFVARDKEGVAQIWVRDLSQDERDTNPNLSKDGTRLVFESDQRLWTATADGSDVREVAGTPAFYYAVPMGPALSPDGSQVAFFRPEAGPNGDLWVVPAHGGTARQLTFDLREGGCRRRCG